MFDPSKMSLSTKVPQLLGGEPLLLSAQCHPVIRRPGLTGVTRGTVVPGIIKMTGATSLRHPRLFHPDFLQLFLKLFLYARCEYQRFLHSAKQATLFKNGRSNTRCLTITIPRFVKKNQQCM